MGANERRCEMSQLMQAWGQYCQEPRENSSYLETRRVRRAFFAGAGTVLDLIFARLDRNPIPTEADVREMEAMLVEINQELK